MPFDLGKLDERQARIYRGLTDFISPGTADWFADACRLMNLADTENPPFRFATQAHLMAHLLREVESALGRVLRSIPGTPEALDEGRQLALEGAIREAVGRVQVEEETAEHVLREVAEAVAEWAGDLDPRTGHKNRVTAALHALKISATEPAGRTWLKLADQKFASRAHRNALGPPRPLDAEFRGLWDETQAMLDRVLERVAVTFLPFLDRVRVLAALQQPTRDARTALSNEFPQDEQGVVLREFFAHATPGWVDLLATGGYFTNPPQAHVDENGSASFEDWAPSRYLARIAVARPSAVARIITDIRTDNPLIHTNLLLAALELPPDHARRVVPAVKHWVGQPHKLFENRLYGHLVAHLARAGFLEDAFDLARDVLVVEDPDADGDTPEARAVSRWMRGPQSRIGPWDYGEILRDDVAILFEQDPGSTLLLLRDILAEALRIQQMSLARIVDGDVVGDDRENASTRWEDGSTTTFPILEPGGGRDQVEHLLLEALLAFMDQLAEQQPDRLSWLVGIMEAQRWALFHRMSLRLLSRHAGVAMDLVEDRLADVARFDDPSIRPEYDALAAAAFPNLHPDIQRIYLDLVAQGLGGVYRRASEGNSDAPEVAYTLEDEDRWRHDRLVPIAAHLDPEWRARLNEIGERITGAEAARRPQPVQAPAELAPEQIDQMEVDELLTAAIEGRTGDGAVFATENLVGAVERTPRRFADVAERFQQLPLAIRQAFFDGLIAPANEGPEFGWGPVLSLMERVAAEQESDGELGPERLLEAVIHLLQGGLRPSRSVQIPPDFSALLLAAVDSVARWWITESRQLGQTDDATRIGWRAGLGRDVVRLLVSGGSWFRRISADADVPGPGPVPRQLCAALESFLEQRPEEAPWVRETFASLYPQFIALDQEWAESIRELVFPPGDAELEEFQRVWTAYLQNRAWAGAVQPLRAEYSRAVESLAHMSDEEGPLEGQRFAWLLMTHYFNGHLDLAPGGLVDRFFHNAPPALRAHALELLARGFSSPKVVLTEEQRFRLRAFVDYRIEKAIADPKTARDLVWFGWWVGSQKFELEWIIDRLRRILALTGGQILRSRDVVGVLAELVPHQTPVALELLEMIARGCETGGEVSAWWEHGTTILHAALEAGGASRDAAVELVNRLSAPPFGFAQSAEWFRRRQSPVDE